MVPIQFHGKNKINQLISSNRGSYGKNSTNFHFQQPYIDSIKSLYEEQNWVKWLKELSPLPAMGDNLKWMFWYWQSH